MDAEPYGDVDCGAQPGCLVRVRPRGRNPEDVGEQLDDGSRLRATARYPQLGDRDLALPNRSLGAFTERVRKPLDDGPVHVGPAVHVAEPDQRALRLRAGVADARHPVRLEDEAHRAWGRGIEECLEHGFGRDVEDGRAGDLGRPELALEPLDHPEAAEHLELDEPRPRERGGVGRHERDRLEVAAMRRPDRGRRPERQRGDLGTDRA